MDRAGQKAKLLSILHYFDLLEGDETSRMLDGRMIVSRQVMTSKQWLTIEDWLESAISLCPITIRHSGRMDKPDSSQSKLLRVCFASRRFGGGVLDKDLTQETVHVSE